MVTYKSDGIFDAPLDRIWKLLQEQHSPEQIVKTHPVFQKVRNVEEKGNNLVREEVVKGPTGPYTERVRFTYNPPKGFDMEWLTGPLAGSRATHSYTSQGNKTRVDVSGDFKIQGLDEKGTYKMINDFMNRVFDEDGVALRKLK
jgi:ligand-binding SRPBCC domain-containing protein